MNPLTKVKLINELNKREAELGVKDSVSWHSVYKDSAWIFIGGFPYELTEGDLICVFSQYGEIANINLVRDKKTGKSKGFCFICYEDQRSTILAVDNFNGIKIKGRTIRVDHVQNYRPPKDTDDIDEVTKRLREEGCAPQLPSSSSESEEEEHAVVVKKSKKEKKKKKKQKKEKAPKEEKRSAEAELGASVPRTVKQEKEDAGYEKYSQHRLAQDRLARGERQVQQGREPHMAWQADSQFRGGERDRDRGGDREERGKRDRDRGGERERGDRDRGDRERDRDRRKDRERERDRDGWAAREDDKKKERSQEEREGKDASRWSQERSGRQRDGERRHKDSDRERAWANKMRESH